MKKEVIFITGNQGKHKTLCHYLEPIGWKVNKLDLLLKEIQHFSLEEVCLNKVEQAIQYKINPPFIITDGGLFIDSLGGFPGAYTKPVSEKIGCQGLLKLLESSKNRNCYFEMCLIYFDENRTSHIFKNIVEGKVAKQLNENKNELAWGSVWDIFIPKGGKTVISSMSNDEYNDLKDKYQKGSAWKDLVKFLKEKYD